MKAQTNFEYIKSCETPEELKKFFCDEVQKGDCDQCPVQDDCYLKHNGFLAFLNAKRERFKG